jgi:hypothetical protein
MFSISSSSSSSLLLLTAIGLSPGGSSPILLVQTKIKIHKTVTTVTTKHKKHKTTK